MKDSTKKEIEGNWQQFTGRIKESWGSLTDDDLMKAKGKVDQLVGRIKERTGETERQIEERLDEIAKPSEAQH